MKQVKEILIYWAFIVRDNKITKLLLGFSSI